MDVVFILDKLSLKLSHTDKSAPTTESTSNLTITSCFCSIQWAVNPLAAATTWEQIWLELFKMDF